MKTFFTTLLLGLALCQSSAALAAPMDIATEQASALPADTRCRLSVGTPVVDYGTLSRWQLQDAGGGQRVTPGKRSMMLNIVCPYTRTLHLALRGDSAGNGDLRYGESGSVSVRIKDAQLDGQAVQMVAARPDGTTSGGDVSGLPLQPGSGFMAVRDGHPARGKSFTARIELEPVMPESAARVGSRQSSESNLTLELIK